MRRRRPTAVDELTTLVGSLQKLVEDLTTRLREQESRIYKSRLLFEQRVIALEQQLEAAMIRTQQREVDHLARLNVALEGHQDAVSSLDSVVSAAGTASP